MSDRYTDDCIERGYAVWNREHPRQVDELRELANQLVKTAGELHALANRLQYGDTYPNSWTYGEVPFSGSVSNDALGGLE